MKTFAVCINNAGYVASLTAGKLYEVVPDPKAEAHGLLRVVDESGEDYGVLKSDGLELVGMRHFDVDEIRPLIEELRQSRNQCLSTIAG